MVKDYKPRWNLKKKPTKEVIRSRKYPHYIKNSYQQKNKMVIILCTCGKRRMVHASSLFQTKFCRNCTNIKRAKRKKEIRRASKIYKKG